MQMASPDYESAEVLWEMSGLAAPQPKGSKAVMPEGPGTAGVPLESQRSGGPAGAPQTVCAANSHSFICSNIRPEAEALLSFSSFFTNLPFLLIIKCK